MIAQRVLKDLEELYSKVKINASSPIVPFRETIQISNRSGLSTITAVTADQSLSFTLEIIPLSKDIYDYMYAKEMNEENIASSDFDKLLLKEYDFDSSK